MTSKDILNYIEYLLNQITTELNYDILFKGSLDVADIDWRRKYFNVEYTPFVLATHMFEPSQDKYGIEFDYTIYTMGFEKDREDLRIVFDKLFEILNGSIEIAGHTLNTRPSENITGLPFIEGSGLGHYRFETLFKFDGTITTFYKLGKDLLLTINGQVLPVESFKYDMGKVGYVNKFQEHTGNNNHNLNSNVLVIQTPLGENNTLINDFLASRQKVNMDAKITLKAKETILIDDDYQYDGFTLSASKQDLTLFAYLYFTFKSDKIAITIDGTEIPILDYAIANKNETMAVKNPLSDTIKNIHLSRARAYSFNVAEELGSTLMEKFSNELIGDIEIIPTYNVTINIYGVEFTKVLLLDDIIKESKETARSILKVSFLESGEDIIG